MPTDMDATTVWDAQVRSPDPSKNSLNTLRPTYFLLIIVIIIIWTLLSSNLVCVLEVIQNNVIQHHRLFHESPRIQWITHNKILPCESLVNHNVNHLWIARESPMNHLWITCESYVNHMWITQESLGNHPGIPRELFVKHLCIIIHESPMNNSWIIM